MSDEASSASCPFTPSSAEGGGSSAEHSPPPVGRRLKWRRLCDVTDTASIPILQLSGDASDAEAMEAEEMGEEEAMEEE